MDEFQQHFAAYMMIMRLTKEIKEYVESGMHHFDYTLKLFEELKERERDYFEINAQEHLFKAINERQEQ